MEEMSPAQRLATKELVKDDGEMVFEDGISRFCPKHSKILKPAVEGTCPRWFQVVQDRVDRRAESVAPALHLFLIGVPTARVARMPDDRETS
ncbi:hypothetical protein [Streptomyces sp. NBC_01092]|uniref:hypothetical protein n=1 Tax=Streptomyces sp. NBC_01092 TaxID=2903748 RepID=UPI00386488A5|nr:hypothetical protein OG254_06845 [Streptomyces sp. NBC_01092]